MGLCAQEILFRYSARVYGVSSESKVKDSLESAVFEHVEFSLSISINSMSIMLNSSTIEGSEDIPRIAVGDVKSVNLSSANL